MLIQSINHLLLQPFLTDRFAFAQQQPAIDPLDRQDLFDIGGSLIDDIQVIL
jgi:hypothetical protein